MAFVSILPDFDESKTDYLLDTNFLFAVFGDLSISNQNRQKKYLDFFQTAKEKKFSLFVTSFSLSEFFNRTLRDYFNNWRNKSDNKGKNFKTDFRPSDTCKECINAIKESLVEITKICKLKDDSFSSYKPADYFPYLTEFDFNDSLFAHVAIKNDYVLVTEDRDFNAPPFNKMSVLTANDTMYHQRDTQH